MPLALQSKTCQPHSLCYINAGILAMMHGLEAASLPWGPLQFLYNLAKNAASRGVVLKLVQSHRFRSLVPEWVYNEVQRDTAEYTHQLLQAQAIHNVQWDARRFGMAGLQLTCSRSASHSYAASPASSQFAGCHYTLAHANRPPCSCTSQRVCMYSA